MSGPLQFDTMIDVPDQESLASVSGLRSGDRIMAIDGRSTDAWQDIGIALLAWTGKTGTFEVTVERDGASFLYPVQVSDWLADQARSRPIEDFGIRRGHAPVLGNQAQESQLQKGDRIVSVSSVPVKTWTQFSHAVTHANKDNLSLEVIRGGTPIVVNVRTESLIETTESGGMTMTLMAAPIIALDRDSSFVSRAWDAVVHTYVLIYTTIEQLLKMIIGDYGFSNVFGVLQLTQLGTPAAEMNWQSILMVFALISILGGLINLLPGVITDGIDIITPIIELIRKKPLSEISNIVLVSLGTLAGLTPLVLVITFDLMRVFT